jgi:hypothetical protein
MKVKAIDEVFVFNNDYFYYYPVNTIFEVVDTKFMPHDNKEWYKIKIGDLICDGFCNPKDFEVLK